MRTEGLSVDFRHRLILQVRSSLVARHVDVCVSEEESLSAPLATLEVTPTDAETIATTITVNDGVTRKRVARDLDLRGIPPDGRALTIAVALDELLRASWAELLLSDVRPSATAPKVVTDAVLPNAEASAPAQTLPKAWEVGVAMGAARFTEGHSQLGVDVIAGYFPWSRLGFCARLGVRSGFAVQAPHGEIRSTALALRLGVNAAVLPRTGRVGVDLLGEALLTRVTFVAEPSSTAGVRGSERTAAASYVVMGARAWYVLLQPLRAFVQVGGGVPLHTAYAADGDVRVTGLGGLLVTGDVGFSSAF